VELIPAVSAQVLKVCMQLQSIKYIYTYVLTVNNKNMHITLLPVLWSTPSYTDLLSFAKLLCLLQAANRNETNYQQILYVHIWLYGPLFIDTVYVQTGGNKTDSWSGLWTKWRLIHLLYIIFCLITTMCCRGGEAHL